METRSLQNTYWSQLPLWKYLAFLAWTSFVLFLQHRELSQWDGLMGSISQKDLGKNGTASWPSIPPDEIVAYSRGWQRYQYNAWLAERIPLSRSLPDFRDKRCLYYTHEQNWDEMRPASLVVIFRNEQLMVVLRTLHSLVARTPRHLYHELILVDDHSDASFWSEELSLFFFDSYIRRYLYTNARIFHLQEPVGLIRARVFAAREAKTNTLVFVDAQVEVTEGWLTPLLGSITENILALAIPVLDRIDEQTMEYRRSREKRAIFDWSLSRREVPLTKAQSQSLPKPYEVALMRSPVFAITSLWFQDLSDFDTNLQGFGGAELELSFKVWRSGGRVVQVPCSRVGHLEPRDQDYLRRFGDLNILGESKSRNLKRIIELWIDNPILKDLVYRYQPHLKNKSEGDLSESQNSYKEHDCQSFMSFVDDVMPALLQITPRNRTDRGSGSIRPFVLDKSCLTVNRKFRLSLEPCRANSIHQNWTLTYLNDLRVRAVICLEVLQNLTLGLNFCHNLGGRQDWHYDEASNYLVSSSKCLELSDNRGIIMTPCRKNNTRQKWVFEHPNPEAMEGDAF
ncbi:putative inactive polypeptide N-acetylgalactosaminyltransferase 12 [Drosophila bipectinata]|uniref:putative inactive polypeptide N-acetylgalactosaminyltransferase 12 n=1 Tax=Drosophila bipectinata TaxID=42026 RepID=UPI001C89204C|nr:putative polypeptide N-acetylgalactosaminyltransferase 12 [Drosophila bipectinata]